MITETDRKLLDHVTNYGFCTISQARDMFYNTQKFGYEICRKRMQKLVDGDYLKEFRNDDTNEKVFYDPKHQIKRVSLHLMLLMNYYAKLVNAGAEIKYFQKEKEWMNGEIRSDAFVIYEFGNWSFFQLVEVHVSHNKLNLEKYLKLYETKEVQQICGGHFPRVILIDDTSHKKEIELNNIKVVQLDFKLNEFNKIFL